MANPAEYLLVLTYIVFKVIKGRFGNVFVISAEKLCNQPKVQPEMLDSPSNKALAIFVSVLLTEITKVIILVSFTYHDRTL